MEGSFQGFTYIYVFVAQYLDWPPHIDFIVLKNHRRKRDGVRLLAFPRLNQSRGHTWLVSQTSLYTSCVQDWCSQMYPDHLFHLCSSHSLRDQILQIKWQPVCRDPGTHLGWELDKKDNVACLCVSQSSTVWQFWFHMLLKCILREESFHRTIKSTQTPYFTDLVDLLIQNHSRTWTPTKCRLFHV